MTNSQRSDTIDWFLGICNQCAKIRQQDKMNLKYLLSPLLFTHCFSCLMRDWHLELITVSFFLTFAFGGLDADFLVILLESGEIFTGFGEFTLLSSNF